MAIMICDFASTSKHGNKNLLCGTNKNKNVALLNAEWRLPRSRGKRHAPVANATGVCVAPVANATGVPHSRGGSQNDVAIQKAEN